MPVEQPRSAGGSGCLGTAALPRRRLVVAAFSMEKNTEFTFVTFSLHLDSEPLAHTQGYLPLQISPSHRAMSVNKVPI